MTVYIGGGENFNQYWGHELWSMVILIKSCRLFNKKWSHFHVTIKLIIHCTLQVIFHSGALRSHSFVNFTTQVTVPVNWFAWLDSGVILLNPRNAYLPLNSEVQEFWYLGHWVICNLIDDVATFNKLCVVFFPENDVDRYQQLIQEDWNAQTMVEFTQSPHGNLHVHQVRMTVWLLFQSIEPKN